MTDHPSANSEQANNKAVTASSGTSPDQRLRRDLASGDEAVVFGFWVYLMSDCVLFAGLFATYAVLQGATFGGLSAKDIFDFPFVLTETLVLLTSSFTIGLALLFATKSRALATFLALVATLTLGVVFLTMEVNEFMHLVGEGSGPSQSAFLSAFFTLVGTHGLHVFLGSVWMFVLMLHLVQRGITEGTVRKLTMMSLFWHFLDIIWIFIFTFVYLIGTLV